MAMRFTDSSDELELNHDINVTPFIDVMLVLLIIFMVTAPLLNNGVPIELPESAANPLPSDAKPVEVSIDTQGIVYIGEEPISDADLRVRLWNWPNCSASRARRAGRSTTRGCGWHWPQPPRACRSASRASFSSIRPSGKRS